MDELDGTNGATAFDKRSGDVFQCSEQVKKDIRKIAPYWHGHTHQDEVASNLTDEIRDASTPGSFTSWRYLKFRRWTYRSKT